METSELLREIAAVMAKDPDSGFMEFECQHNRADSWTPFDFGGGWAGLLFKAEDPGTYRVRRRPRTIKVVGEVPEEAIQAARFIADKSSGFSSNNFSNVQRVSRALLDLVEKGGE